MKLKSLIQNSNRLEVAEVEIEFIPGIPQIHFLGLPDRLIKESFYRIKSALKSSGYRFPVTNQMIVNIKPNHLRKSSRGVELAVALGILLKTGQVPAEKIGADWVIYGELGLDGSVHEPSDLQQNMFHLRGFDILTGKGKNSHGFSFSSLRDMEIVRHDSSPVFKRPAAGIERSFTADEAEFLFLAAVSRLHALLAGDSGAGKSTLARSLNSFLPEPDEKESIRIEKSWRPFVAPHQSLTSAAFLGGGAGLFEGEIERAEGGILLLDEFLEFEPEILESLRGPMTGENLRISRGAGHREILPAIQVIATTNLCPCGKWSPQNNDINCRFSRLKCGRTLEKFSGPLLDRFGLLMFCHNQGGRQFSGKKVLERVLNSLGFPILPLPPPIEAYYRSLSARRRNYLRTIASIYAFERTQNAQGSSAGLTMEDCNRAERWVIKPFEQLERGMS